MRKGDSLPSIPVFIFLVIGAVAALGVVTFAGQVADTSSKKATAAYTESLIAVDVVGAPCATKERGVFYRSSVVSGDFRCLTPEESIGIRIDTQDGELYQWTLVRNEDGIEIEQGASVDFVQEYSVTIYDSKTGTYTPAEVAVGR